MSLTPSPAIPRGHCLLQRGEKPGMLNVEMCWLLPLINETSTLGTLITNWTFIKQHQLKSYYFCIAKKK